MAVGSFLLWLAGASMACDQGYLTQTKNDFETSKAAADVKFRRLVGSLAESCTFAPTLGSTLTALTGADIPMRPKLEQKVVLAEAGAWSSACPGGKAAFDAAFAVSGDAREAALYGACNVGRYRYAAAGELGKGTGVVFLSILVAKHFEEKQIPDSLSVPLLRALAGLPGSAPPASTAAAPTAASP